MPGQLCSVVLFCVLFSSAFADEALPLMQAKAWQADADPAGWWMSEKYDGMRGYWDGTQMLSRQGNRLVLPAHLQASLPPFALDGELWAGRGRFEETIATVRTQLPGPGWADIRYMVFDVPRVPGSFEQRMQVASNWLQKHPAAWIELVEQTRCKNKAHLDKFLQIVERKGGEGVMLHAAGSAYTAGRSPDLRKYKSFADTEARVIGYKPGKGKYAGMVGSLLVETDDGLRFAIGSGLRDIDRQIPPPIGSLITFKHYGWTAKGKPRFPVYWRPYVSVDQ
ncbi:MAG: DNA ligase [Thiohalomonadaceae bacterium]